MGMTERNHPKSDGILLKNLPVCDLILSLKCKVINQEALIF